MFHLLSECLLRVLVEEWLDLKSITRLDTCYCGHDFRAHLLTMLKSRTVLSADLVGVDAKSWITLRRTTATNVSVWSYADSWADKTQSDTGISSVHMLNLFHHINCKCDIVPVCCNLTEFYCDTIHVNHLARLLEHNQKLRTLVFAINDDCTSDFKSVSLLDLTALYIVVYSTNVFVSGALIARAPKLEKVSITYDMPDPATKHIDTRCDSLKALQLKNTVLTNVNMRHIVRLCPNIAHLSLQNCSTLSDHAVEIVAENLQSLRTLNLSDCRCITDTGLQYLIDYCSDTLEVLQLSSNENISRDAMGELRRQCPNLHTLHSITNCYRAAPRVRSLQQILHERKTTVLKMSYFIGSEFAVNGVAACDSIEILHQKYDHSMKAHLCITTRVLKKLCAKWPRLHTIIVEEEALPKTVRAARDLPQLTITSDAAVYEYDILTMGN